MTVQFNEATQEGFEAILLRETVYACSLIWPIRVKNKERR